jgi:ribonuclease BN (tRNA processing enzyme)
MKIKVLGCSGVESPGHRPPSFLLGGKIAFDAGSLTNVLSTKDLLKIEHIFITHTHLDHIMGIPFLADHLMFSEKRHTVSIIGIPAVIGAIRRSLLDGSIWPDFTAIPDTHEAILTLNELEPGQSMKIGAYTITPYKVNHPVPASGYLVEDERERRFFYTGDTGPSDATWEEIGEKQIHCLIIDVSFPNHMEQIAIKTGHLTPRLLKEELLKMKLSPKKTYVIHIKSQYLKLVKKELKELGIENVALLKEGDVIRL